MSENKAQNSKKYLVFLLLTILGIGIFIFWLATLDLSPLREKSSQNLKNLQEIAQESNLFEGTTQNFEEIQRQLQKEEGNQILKERNLNLTQTKKGLRITLLDVVFKTKETWIYLNIKNHNAARVLLRSGHTSEIKIIQNDKEFLENKTQKIIDYPLKDILTEREETLGTSHFSNIDPNQPFILFIKGVQLEGAEEHFNFLFKVE